MDEEKFRRFVQHIKKNAKDGEFIARLADLASKWGKTEVNQMLRELVHKQIANVVYTTGNGAEVVITLLK